MPEPPFVPFDGHFLRGAMPIDDGRKPTVLSSLFRSLWAQPEAPPPPEEDDEPEPTKLERGELVELPVVLPAGFDTRGHEFDAFLRSLICREPITFELVGTSAHVTAQLVVSADDADNVRQRLRAFFPALVTTPTKAFLQSAWTTAGEVAAAVEFGLARECVFPLSSVPFDPYVALVGVLSELRAGECAIFQVLWQNVENKWAENLVRSVTGQTGRPAFVNAPELTGAASAKVGRPLFAAVVRIAACSPEAERTWEILRLLAGGLRPFANPNGNELMPLRNDEYPYDAHIDDVLRRQSRRAGMILNSDELLGLVHLPSSAVRSPRFRRQLRKTKAAPSIVVNETGLLLGENDHAGEHQSVRLNREQRRRHMHVIGASGTGKTTLLFNLIRQDIDTGEGLAVLDPHGDLIDRILGVIPPERVNDVVLLDPGDEDFSVGFNILSAHSELEKTLLASDLVSVFERLSTSWGDQMGIVLGNAIRAFLESEKGGTLADLRRFLLDSEFRGRFLQTVRDPDIVYYWRKGFPQLAGNKSIGPVMTRLETFLSPKPVRYMVSQTENRLDFANILDTGKIFLAKLSQGAIGKENAYLLGSLLMAKFQQIAMGRQHQHEAARRDFWLYLDEFHNFITPSMAEILSGARKYRVGLTLAHQELRQLQRDSEVASAVLANPYTRVCFRVGDQDARVLEHGFSSFEARDFQNLGTGEAICRVERSDYDFNLSIPAPHLPDDTAAAHRHAEVVTASREKYATRREDVEAALREPAAVEFAAEPTPAPTSKPKAVPASDNRAATSPVITPEPVLPVQPKEPPVMPTTSALAAPAPPAPASAVLPVNQPVTAASEVKQPAPVGDPGRGGIQHKAIQKRIKEAADALGFKTAIEHEILDGAGSVDLLLARGDAKIACEITVTTTIDHEVGNVAKCAKAGFQEISVVSVTAEKLARIETAVTNSLGPDIAQRVRYFLPNQFISHLQALPKPRPPIPEARVSRGYKIKRIYPQLTPEEAKAREGAAIRAIADLMRRKP
ncbi:MAG: type IV secretion system DNA-binding domain-containing protein [Verrucomicrobia bacterium]|nr:type IV secretion system DNA-binding domain-containing protein [Verrucomicrobiota bacterium]